MTAKETLIDSIRQHNPTAGAEFLIGFDEPALERYLTHLRHLSNPRSAASPWVRTFETRAVVSRTRAAAL